MNIREQALQMVVTDLRRGLYSADEAGRDIVDQLEAAGLLRSDPPDEGEIMSFRTTGNNSHLIEDCFKLGYLADDMAILDPTYGMGVFWKRHRPPYLIGSDLEPSKSPGGVEPKVIYGPDDEMHDATIAPGHSIDFTKMPWTDEQFDAVVFDPDYKMQGTSSNEGPASSNGAYGMDREYRSVDEQMGNIASGLMECVRVTKPGGVIAVKHMDQVVSGSVTWQSDDIYVVMLHLGCGKFAEFHLEGHRKQPTHDKCRACHGTGTVSEQPIETAVVADVCWRCQGKGEVRRRQVHERRNYSTLALYRKAKS